jgi:hypothetical protein
MGPFSLKKRSRPALPLKGVSTTSSLPEEKNILAAAPAGNDKGAEDGSISLKSSPPDAMSFSYLTLNTITPFEFG